MKAKKNRDQCEIDFCEKSIGENYKEKDRKEITQKQGLYMRTPEKHQKIAHPKPERC